MQVAKKKQGSDSLAGQTLTQESLAHKRCIGIHMAEGKRVSIVSVIGIHAHVQY